MNVKANGPSNQPGVLWIAVAVVLAALFGAMPAIWDVVETIRYRDAPGSPFVARWALLMLLIGGVEAAYGLYLVQLPDWASVWVVTLVLLTITGFYAMGLAVVLIADPAGWLLGADGLQLTEKLTAGKAALWCLCLVSLSTILAFFAGRLSFHWRRTEMMRRRAGL